MGDNMGMTELDRTVCWAPMMGYSDRHARMLMRLISPNSLLFTEMVVASALIMGDRERLLRHGADGPCVLQIGGSDPKQLAEAAKIGEQAGYEEVNLNVGCPSDRVQQGAIGACLMAEPQLVADCISAMHDAVKIPVTVKCRIGIDNKESYEDFSSFIQTVSTGNCDVFYVHARSAWLQGLSPKENREIPPLKYQYVKDIQNDFPDLTFILNGGISSADHALEHLKDFPGIMIGRAIYKDPYLLAELEQAIYKRPIPERRHVIDQYLEYGYTQADPVRHLLKHLLSLYTNRPGARAYRRYLSEHMNDGTAKLDMIYQALDAANIGETERQQANEGLHLQKA